MGDGAGEASGGIIFAQILPPGFEPRLTGARQDGRLPKSKGASLKTNRRTGNMEKYNFTVADDSFILWMLKLIVSGYMAPVVIIMRVFGYDWNWE